MNSPVARPVKLAMVDPLWEAVVSGAQQIGENEPALGNLVYASVLNHESFESALIHRLASRLDHAEVSADLLRRAFQDALELRPEIAVEARADLIATLERDPACHKSVDAFLHFKGFHAIQTHRFAHALWMHGRRDLALYLQGRSSQVFQVDINPAARVGKGIMLDHATGFVVGETASIGNNVSILQGVTLGGTGKADEDRHPKIGNGVLIGAGAIILGNIRVGDCARVGAGSVVVKEVPANVTVVGVPARVIGEAGAPQPSAAMDQVAFELQTVTTE